MRPTNSTRVDQSAATGCGPPSGVGDSNTRGSSERTSWTSWTCKTLVSLASLKSYISLCTWKTRKARKCEHSLVITRCLQAVWVIILSIVGSWFFFRRLSCTIREHSYHSFMVIVDRVMHKWHFKLPCVLIAALE